MIDLNERCPVCGGVIGYHINSYGQIVKQCSNCKHIVAETVVKTNKTALTDFNKQSTYTNSVLPKKMLDKLASPTSSFDIYNAPPALEINCDSITLKQNDINICFDSEEDIKQFDSITLNGVKFKKVEE